MISNQQKGKEKKNKTKFVSSKCDVSKTTNTKHYTCYDRQGLMTMKKLWNTRHPDAKILENTERGIWNAFKTNLRDVCNSEKCWLRQEFAKNNLSKDLAVYTFAPEAPIKWRLNPNEWLSSVDIEKVMKQYENKHDDFVFLGPSPIDFDTRIMGNTCVWTDICNLSIANMIAHNKFKLGMIFNTDPHYLSGSHWISLFVDLKKKFVFFFDSTGDKPPKEIEQLITRIIAQSTGAGLKLNLFINDKPHQKGDTECGMYSLYMIIGLLTKAMTVEDFTTKRITDTQMEKLRKEYFNFTT